MGWGSTSGERYRKRKQDPWGEVIGPRCPQTGGWSRTAQLGEATKWTTEGTDVAGKLRNMLPEFKGQSHT